MQTMSPLYNNKKHQLPYTTGGYPSHSSQVLMPYSYLPNASQMEYCGPANIYTQISQINDSSSNHNNIDPLINGNFNNIPINSAFLRIKTPKVRRRAFSKRSKTGCFTCRERRIKCDECKPVCKNCTKSKRTCKFPDPEKVKEKTTKFKSNTNPKKIEIDSNQTNIFKDASDQQNTSIQQHEALTLMESSNRDSLAKNIKIKNNPFENNSLNQITSHSYETSSKTKFPLLPFAKHANENHEEQNKINYPFNPVSSNSSSITEPSSFTPSTYSSYQTQQIKYPSERAQAVQFQQQQQQPQQVLSKQYLNTHQYNSFYPYAYSLPQTQISEDISFKPQFQNPQLNPLGYYAYNDSTITSNIGILNSNSNYGNPVNKSSTSYHLGSNFYTQSNTEPFPSNVEDKEYSYLSIRQQNQPDNASFSGQTPLPHFYNNHQLPMHQFQQNTQNYNNSFQQNHQSNDHNHLH